MKVNKKGALNQETLVVWIVGIILAIILIEVAAELIPQGQTAGDGLNESGVPLGEFFASGGIVWLIVMAGLVIVFVLTFLKGMKKK